MSYKSFNRFFGFTLAIVTALFFFGFKPSQLHENHKTFVAFQSNEIGQNSIHEGMHEPDVPHPVAIESKEEQPSEDDENFDSNDSSEFLLGYDFTQTDLSSLSEKDNVINTSRGNFHCPLHIRIRSIII